MPLDEYFGGKGDSVMRSLQKKHGAKRGERIFYATANKMKGKKKVGVRKKK